MKDKVSCHCPLFVSADGVENLVVGNPYTPDVTGFSSEKFSGSVVQVFIFLRSSMALLFRYLSIWEALWLCCSNIYHLEVLQLCCSDIYPSKKFSSSVQVFIGSRSSPALLFTYLFVREVFWHCCAGIYRFKKLSGSVVQIFIHLRSSPALLLKYLSIWEALRLCCSNIYPSEKLSYWLQILLVNQ